MKVQQYLSKPILAITVVILGTLAAQIPAIERLLIQFTDAHPHLALLADGIIVILLLILTMRENSGAKP